MSFLNWDPVSVPPRALPILSPAQSDCQGQQDMGAIREQSHDAWSICQLLCALLVMQDLRSLFSLAVRHHPYLSNQACFPTLQMHQLLTSEYGASPSGTYQEDIFILEISGAQASSSLVAFLGEEPQCSGRATWKIIKTKRHLWSVDFDLRLCYIGLVILFVCLTPVFLQTDIITSSEGRRILGGQQKNIQACLQSLFEGVQYSQWLGNNSLTTAQSTKGAFGILSYWEHTETLPWQKKCTNSQTSHPDNTICLICRIVCSYHSGLIGTWRGFWIEASYPQSQENAEEDDCSSSLLFNQVFCLNKVI